MTGNQSSQLGQVKVEGDNATLTFERRLPHTPEEVWRAITDPSELSNWHMDARIEAKVGGSVEFSSETGRVTGRILAWDPPRVFEHEWNVNRLGFPKGEYGVIKWELFPEEGGDHTLLKLTHRKLDKQFAHNFAPGTHVMLDRLEIYLDGTALPDWPKQLEKSQAKYSLSGIS